MHCQTPHGHLGLIIDTWNVDESTWRWADGGADALGAAGALALPPLRPRVLSGFLGLPR